MLHWSDDEWNTANDTPSTPTALGIEYVDLQVDKPQKAPLRFTFFWPRITSGRARIMLCRSNIRRRSGQTQPE